jgi:hypothetical protein
MMEWVKQRIATRHATMAVGASAGLVVVWLYRRWMSNRKNPSAGGSMEVIFEFGQTSESETFFDRNPKFYPAFERLAALINKCFGRPVRHKNRTEEVCFSLGETCREDFMEILFLAANGYATGASKLLRGLYERAVALAYIVKHPEKAERFVRYAGIQEYKAMNVALKAVSEKDWDAAVEPNNAAAKIRERYEMVKEEFQTTLCKKCDHKGTAFSWDIDVASMVRDVGPKFERLYLVSYQIANLHVHATLASTANLSQEGEPQEERAQKRHQEADFALWNATLILLLVVEVQNTLFNLNLGKDIAACEQDTQSVWVPS